MSWLTHPVFIWCRNFGRILGVNRLIATQLTTPGYEVQYDRQFAAALIPGDCVWDIGANIGYYTRMFSERVGKAGKVFGFEPSSLNFFHLNKACEELSNVNLFQIALGRENGKLAFAQGIDDIGATSRILDSGSNDQEMTVEVRSGSNLIANGDAMPPNAIKIDVEGFEYEVLEGLSDSLSSSDLHLIGIEMHFGILKERGMPNAPKQIERMLSEHGYALQWTDASHLLATRYAM